MSEKIIKNITIIGDGGWGTALAILLSRNGHSVTVWGHDADYIKEIIKNHVNYKFLPLINIPEAIKWSDDKQEATCKADIVVIAVPSKYYRITLESFAAFIPKSALIVSVTKGLDPEKRIRMSQIVSEILKITDVAILSGPSYAEEVARDIPTAVVIACSNMAKACELQYIFSNQNFRAYTCEDVVGVEFGGALKNIIAIAAGASDGIGFGDNTKAALVTRGLAEIARIGISLGAKTKTFYGLSGLGDLVVTCTGKLSRNRAVGERIGAGESIKNIISSMEQVAEGIWTCDTAKKIIDNYNIRAPIVNEVYSVLYENKNPRDAVLCLTRRELISEDV